MDDRTRETLEARRQRYGAAPPERTAPNVVGSFVGLRIHDVTLGLPVTLVHEFAPLKHWVPLAAGRNILGIAQLRGEVLALVDLLAALTGRASPAASWMVVVQGRGGRAAAPVAEVLGTRVVTESDLAPASQVTPLCDATTRVTRDLWHLVDAVALTAALDAGAEPNPSRRS